MTDKPTPEQIQRACDLANGPNDATPWFPGHYGACTVITALADTIAKLDAMQAERDKARADLGEIDRIAKAALWHINLPTGPSNRVAAIAAPYRVETDPLLLEAREIAAASDNMVAANVRAGEWDNSHIVQCCLAALKRGLEIGRQA